MTKSKSFERLIKKLEKRKDVLQKQMNEVQEDIDNLVAISGSDK